MTQVKVVRTTTHLKWLKSKLMEVPVISYDIETSSEGSGKNHRYHKPWDPHSQIVMIGFAWEEGVGVAVPLHHAESKWSDADGVLHYLKPALEQPKVKYVAHNGKFDCTWLAHKGVFVNQTFDTMLAAHILDENRYKGLKILSELVLGVDAYDVGEDLKDAYNMPLRRLATYQAKDVDYTLRLYNIFKAQLLEEPRPRKVFQKLMMPASNVLTKVETYGIYIDPEHLKEQTLIYIKKRDEIEAELRTYLPVGKEELNFRSPKQVAIWLFKDLKLPVMELTKTKQPSTAESVMLRLAQLHPAPALLLKYRTYESKYLRTYLESWDVKRDKKSRIHTNYKLFGTVTGRLSSEKPNMQQVPREQTMRSVFGAPSGWQFLEADYSQAEMRIVAMLSHDPTLLRIFATGGDPHLTTAAEMARLTVDEVRASDAAGETEHRKRAKAVNFGFLYRMGWEKFIDYARDKYEVVVTEAEAKRYRSNFYSLYAKLGPWHDRQVRLAGRYGRVHSPIGRVRHLPDMWSDDPKLRGEAERQAINSPVQSFASDLMLVSMVRLDKLLSPRDAFMVGTFHDAIGFQVRESQVAKVAPIIRATMEDMAYVEETFDAEITVPIEVEIKVGQHWGTGKVI